MAPSSTSDRNSARNAFPHLTPLAAPTLPCQRINNAEVVLYTRLHEFRDIHAYELGALERHTTRRIQIEHRTVTIIDPRGPGQIAQTLRSRGVGSLNETAPDLSKNRGEHRRLIGRRRPKVRANIVCVQCSRDRVLVVEGCAISAVEG